MAWPEPKYFILHLLTCAQDIIRPLPFVMPHDRGQRPAWMIRAGLFLYDSLARRQFLPGAQDIDLRRHAAGQPLKPAFTRGFAYFDAWVDDARLIKGALFQAGHRGAGCALVVRPLLSVDRIHAGAAFKIGLSRRRLPRVSVLR